MTTAFVPIVLPHELMYMLYHLSQSLFNTVFAVSGIRRFWELFGRGSSDHPHFDASICDFIIPLRIWGDDSAHSRVDSFEGITMTSSVHFGVNHWFCKLLLAMLSLKNAVTQTHERLYTILVWSLGICASGKMPPSDDRGISWIDRGKDGDMWRASVSGNDIAGPYRAIFWELSGDLKWEKEACQLPHNYSCKACCPFCPAVGIDYVEDGHEHLSCLNFDSEAEIFMTDNLRTQEQLVNCFVAEGIPVPAWVGAPGFDIQRSLLLDFQHCNALGLCHRHNGNVLVCLAEDGKFGTFGGNWDTRLSIQLRRAYSEYSKWAKSNLRQCPQLSGLISKRLSFPRTTSLFFLLRNWSLNTKTFEDKTMHFLEMGP